MLEIQQTAAGVPTALLDGKLLHSARDPQKEASRATEQLARREPACVVVLGFGLGYQTEALVAATESLRVIVFEPDAELSHELATARDVTALLSSGRVTWCENTEALEDALLSDATEGFEVISLKARRDADPDSFAAAERVIDSFRSRLEINSNTLIRFGRLWVKNLCKNVNALAAGVPVSSLAGIFKGTPGLLLAAGPGLEQVLDDLPDLAQRMVVVAVDTAVRVCRDHGVDPDIAVVVDPQYWNARHLDRVEPGRTLLVAESSSHPTVFRHFGSPPVFCSSLFPLGQQLEAELGPMGSLGAGGSVSTTAWDLLRVVGCDPVCVAGLDLGFPRGRTHFRGSFFEDLALASGKRLAPAENTIYRYVSSADPHLVEANDGTEVVTDRRMEIYRRWFARHVADDGSPTTFTLSNGGVKIEGIDSMSPSALSSMPPVRNRIDEVISRIAPLPGADSIRRGRKIWDQLEGLKEDLAPLGEIVARAIAAVDTIEATLAAGEGADFTPLVGIDEEIRSSRGRSIVSFLMQEAISQIRAGFGSADLGEQAEASRQLYSGLRDSVRFHQAAIQGALDLRGHHEAIQEE